MMIRGRGTDHHDFNLESRLGVGPGTQFIGLGCPSLSRMPGHSQLHGGTGTTAGRGDTRTSPRPGDRATTGHGDWQSG